MPYVLLGAAIILEIIATTLLKSIGRLYKAYTDTVCIVFYVLCFYRFPKHC